MILEQSITKTYTGFGVRALYSVLCLLCAGVAAGCGAKELRTSEFKVAADAPDPAKPPNEFYTIGPGDQLDISVWKEPSLSGNVAVRPDGFVTLPLVNEIQVVGLTTAQLREVLEKKYQEYVTSPTVMVRVEKIASNEIFLVGEVNKPGAYPLTGNDTILQLLTRAGGLTTFADRDSIRIVRRVGEKVTEYIVDYDAILKGDLKQDILLRPGDRVIVP
jgi:polysaccharide export outer membrane protein